MPGMRAGPCWCSARREPWAVAWPRRSPRRARRGPVATGTCPRRAPPPGRAPRLDGVRYHQVDVLEDGALADLFGQQPPPWAVVNAIGGYAPHTRLDAL